MGRNDEAFERYREVYEHDVGYRDVSIKVDNYYTIKKSVSEEVTVGSAPASPAAGSVVAALKAPNARKAPNADLF